MQNLARRRVRRPAGRPAAAVPGLLVVAAGLVAVEQLHTVLDGVSPLVLSAALGAVLGNLGLVRPWAQPGTELAGKRMLRVGVALLGFRIAFQDVLDVGAAGLVAVGLVVVVTFFGTRRLGTRLGVSPGLSLLVAVGFAICGASAIAATAGVVETDEDEVTFSIALVTLCGSLAVVLVPLAAVRLGLEGSTLGTWIGASVHDVAQVVATASATPAPNDEVLRSAVVVKLTRVAMLAPLIAALSLRQSGRTKGAARPPAVPLFVVGFLLATLVRSSDALPPSWYDLCRTVEGWALGAGLFALGTAASVRRLRRLGWRPLLLGLLSWVLVAGTALALVQLFDA